MLHHDLYVNGKPLLQEPPNIHEQLKATLLVNQYSLEEVVGLYRKPDLQLIEIEGLTSAWVDRDKTFQSLLQQIRSWNKQVMDYRIQKVSTIPNAIVNDQIYRTLCLYLNEVVTTKTQSVAKEQLEKYKQWFHSNNPEPLPPEEVQKSPPIILINQKEIKQYHSSCLQDFKDFNRSIHRNIELPEERLKNFQRHQVSMEQTIHRPQTSQTQRQYKMIDKIETTLRPRTNQGMRKVEESQHTKSAATCFYNQNFPVFEPAIEKVKIHENSKIIMDKAEESLTIRKVSIVESLASEQENEEQDQDALKTDEVDVVEVQNNEAVAQKKKKKKKKKKKSKITPSLAPDFRPFANDKETELGYSKFKKLNPNILLNEDDVSKEEKDAFIRIQNIYHQNMNREIRDQREDEEICNNIKDWANNRGRIDELVTFKDEVVSTISRFGTLGIKMSQVFQKEPKYIIRNNKTQSLDIQQLKPIETKEEVDDDKAYQRYLQITQKDIFREQPQTITHQQPIIKTFDFSSTQSIKGQKYYDPNIKVMDLEQKMKIEKFNNLKKQRGSYLPGGIGYNDLEPEEIERRKQLSSSLYGTQKWNSQRQNRPFSGIFKIASTDLIMREQVSEIETLKSFLAKRNQMCSAKTLQKSLMIPQMLEKYNTLPLPLPGQGLEQAPDFYKVVGQLKVGGKKKSKKAKKKK